MANQNPRHAPWPMKGSCPAAPDFKVIPCVTDRQKLMTRPSNLAHTSADVDLQALLTELHAELSENRATNPFALLARFMLENYNVRVEEEDFDSDSDESIELQPIDAAADAYSDRLLQAIVSGQREIPMRRLLPATPPPSPVPNPALIHRNLIPPPLPPRRRSQLSASMATSSQVSSSNNNNQQRDRFMDLNAAEEYKPPFGGYEVISSPLDKNNELPFTSEYQRRLRNQRNADLPGR